VIIGATGYNDQNGTNDFYIFKYPFNNTFPVSPIWTQTVNTGDLNDHLQDIFVDKTNRRVYVTGYSMEIAYEHTANVKTACLRSSDGYINWESTFNDVGNGFDMGMEIDMDCNYQPYIGAQGSGLTGNEYVVIKYNDATGAESWTTSWNNNDPKNSSYLNDIVVVKEGVYTSGTASWSAPSGFLSVAAFDGVPKTCEPRLAAKNPNETINQNIYPNPSTGKISFSSDEVGVVKIYDIQNRLVDSRSVKAGENYFDLTKLDNGIYYFSCTDEGGNVTRSEKVIISK
jgi:hypothetical protein